ncbi:helix-turn-helix domain-containing protein [[Ruminococcus] torques]
MLVNVEAERVRNQLTKEELADKLGVSLKTYYKIQ